MPDMQTLPFLMNQIVIHLNSEAVLNITSQSTRPEVPRGLCLPVGP